MEASSEDESNPPEPTGDAVNADNLPQAGGGGGAGATAAPPAHPVWAAAAGAGRGSGNKQQQRPESMYAPISMMELEIRGRNDLDGASSTTSDRGGGGGRGRPKERSGGRKREKAKKRVREYDDDDDDHDGDREGEECNDDDDDDGRSAASLDIAGAAFGGAASKKRACAPCGSVAESDDGASVTSSVVRARHARAFPVSGVTCVGCALPAKIAPVTDFIAKNMSTMAELALYKMAALVYKTKVAEPAEEEGVDVPPWGARIRTNRVPCARSRRVALRTRRLEGGARALPAARGRLAHAALREHPHALGHAEDVGDAAAAPRRRDGRADARQEQRRVHHEDHRRQQSRAHAPRRPGLHQEARVSSATAVLVRVHALCALGTALHADRERVRLRVVHGRTRLTIVPH